MSTSEDFETGKSFLLKGQSARALPFLRRAYLENSSSAELQSYYGLVNALELGQVNQAVDLCAKAVRRDPENADLRFNLAYVYLKAGRKKEGFHALEEGMRLDPKHPAVETIRQKLGVRRHPVIRFLSRGNPLNKYLGLFARRLDRMQRRLQGHSG